MIGHRRGDSGRGKPSTPIPSSATVHVAVAVIADAAGQVLLARRHDDLHQGGLWEFPGGKLEASEDILAALAREIHEELGITVVAARPLIRIHHDYPDKSVLLDVWKVVRWRGEPHGREGQPIRWVAPAALGEYAFPAANAPIITAAQLPPVYPVTPEPDRGLVEFLARLDGLFAAGVRLLQLRAKTLSPQDYSGLAKETLQLARRWGAEVMLNADSDAVTTSGAHGVHLTSARLMRLEKRPLDGRYRVAASCHDERELAHAVRIGVDFVVVAPVLPTTSHPGAVTLGWDGFRRLTELAPVPVYALGGLDCSQLGDAYRNGGQGIAAISALWSANASGSQVQSCLDAMAGTVTLPVPTS